MAAARKDVKLLKGVFGDKFDAVKAALEAGAVPGMSASGKEVQLLKGLFAGNFDAAKAALEAGADANGSPDQPLTPIVIATLADHADIVESLLEHGADPDRPVTEGTPSRVSGVLLSDLIETMHGERVLHIAARYGKIEIVRLLLKQCRADPNVVDGSGCTPLMATCESPDVSMEVVRLLLEAGADPNVAQEKGYTPMHRVAYHGHTDLVDMLYSRAPSTLNGCASNGMTPLYMACFGGHQGMVSTLLSLGARQLPLDSCGFIPLMRATQKGFVGVVRILISDKQMREVGRSDLTMINSLHAAVCARQGVILRLLLTVHGEERRSMWANLDLDGRYLLHYGAGLCYPAAVSVLLEAGADEAARDSEGRIPADVIGLDFGRDYIHQVDHGEGVAIFRMLQRGPAYRARSWAWPSDEEANAGNGVGGNTAAAVLSSSLSMKSAPVFGVRIFRPKENSSTSKIFVRLVDR